MGQKTGHILSKFSKPLAAAVVKYRKSNIVSDKKGIALKYKNILCINYKFLIRNFPQNTFWTRGTPHKVQNIDFLVIK